MCLLLFTKNILLVKMLLFELFYQIDVFKVSCTKILPFLYINYVSLITCLQENYKH